MPNLLFNLQNVPDEEAEEVRELLNDKGILFYETHAGRWRLGLSAIWLIDKQQQDEAKDLLDQYQRQRIVNGLDERQRLQELGLFNAFLENVYQNPIKVLMAISGIILVLLVSVLPFIV